MQRCVPPAPLWDANSVVFRDPAVPVGDDQKQHLELTRSIAQSFNHALGQTYFPLPDPIILDNSSARVMSLTDGTKKMSKSDPSEMSRINLTGACLSRRHAAPSPCCSRCGSALPADGCGSGAVCRQR